jgi:dTDP-glucose 4,6-dehydratase
MSDECEPVNIGNPQEVSILEFANEIIELTGSNSEIIFKELPSDDPKVRQPNIDKAKRVLGWMPEVKRKDGLAKTLAYFKNAVSYSEQLELKIAG